MKKILLIILVLISLTACGKTNEINKENSKEQTKKEDIKETKAKDENAKETNKETEKELYFETPVNVNLHARITDVGQIVNKIVIDLGREDISAKDVEKDTFKVSVKASSEELIKDVKDENNKDVESYGDYEIDRKIVKTEIEGQYINLYLMENEGATLTYLSAGRNVPLNIEYEITQLKDYKITSGDQEIDITNGKYIVNQEIIDEETEKFKSIIVNDGINYQLHEADNSDKLIVWFHGNGEGDFNNSNNNVAQMLANRGTVAWASDEAKEIFGNASVMAFQAPDTWYYAQKDNLLEKAKDQILKVAEELNIPKDKIMVSGASAGGYMTTRMLIKYPELFKVALINCPAIDVASERGGETPTIDELKELLKSKTAIWLVQGEVDGVLSTEQSSMRIFDVLTEGNEVKEKTFKQEFDSDFTTYELENNDNFKLSIYKTTMVDEKPVLDFEEDFDQDGTSETEQFSGHWSWIYTLNNNPKTSNNTTIWQWAADKIVN